MDIPFNARHFMTNNVEKGQSLAQKIFFYTCIPYFYELFAKTLDTKFYNEFVFSDKNSKYANWGLLIKHYS